MLRGRLVAKTKCSTLLPTIQFRSFGARAYHKAPPSPILMPRIEPTELNTPKRLRQYPTKRAPGGAHKKYTIIALHGGGRHRRQHSTPHFLGQMPHDGSERLTGRIIQTKPSCGYIVADKTKETIFYHIKEVDLKGYIKMITGQRVTFQLKKFNNQTVASVIRPLVQKFNPRIEIDLQTGQLIKPTAAV